VQTKLRDLHREHGSGKLTLESQRNLTWRHSVQALEDREADGMLVLLDVDRLPGLESSLLGKFQSYYPRQVVPSVRSR
jgi:hypothetical protein